MATFLHSIIPEVPLDEWISFVQRYTFPNGCHISIPIVTVEDEGDHAEEVDPIIRERQIYRKAQIALQKTNTIFAIIYNSCIPILNDIHARNALYQLVYDHL